MEITCLVLTLYLREVLKRRKNRSEPQCALTEWKAKRLQYQWLIYCLVIAYLSANKATSIENPAQMQIFFPENVQFSLSEGLIYNLKWKCGALDLMWLAYGDCCTI